RRNPVIWIRDSCCLCWPKDQATTISSALCRRHCCKQGSNAGYLDCCAVERALEAETWHVVGEGWCAGAGRYIELCRRKLQRGDVHREHRGLLHGHKQHYKQNERRQHLAADGAEITLTNGYSRKKHSAGVLAKHHKLAGVAARQ